MSTAAESLSAYFSRPELDLTSDSSAPMDALPRYMLRFFIPMWAGAGLMDWYWHKKTDIEHTAGARESVLHIAMFGEAGVPLVMALFFEINAAMFAASIAGIITHELTSFVDVRYALNHREVNNWEQHTHSFLEILPLSALSMCAIAHWGQFRAMLGAGPEVPDFTLRLKQRRVPKRYLAEVAAIVAFAVITPYANELWRCWKARREPHYNAGCYE